MTRRDWWLRLAVIAVGLIRPDQAARRRDFDRLARKLTVLATRAPDRLVLLERLTDDLLSRVSDDSRRPKASEQSFEFWNNPDDAVYDTL